MTTKQKKILLLAANPQGTEQLKLNQEIRLIEDALQEGNRREEFTVKPILEVCLDDLQKTIRREKPRIVHFCGHGEGGKGLVVATKSGEHQLLGTQAIAELFKLFAHQVESVVLNACYSEVQAAEINQHINFVVGTKNAIKDDAARFFSQGFYEALFDGESIERAFNFGCNRIQLEIYGQENPERKLVPVYSEADHDYIQLPQQEVLVLLKKDPLNQIELEPKLPNIQNTPCNIKRTGSSNFVGRTEKLEELHQLLQQNEQVTISAIAGMGGIGKTELALQYAIDYQDNYPGSLCWFSVRGKDLETQIIEFAGSYLNIFAPKELESDLAKVEYCLRNWRSEKSLIILDDVPDYDEFYQKNIEPYLPTATNNIKVLMTSRERPGTNISRIDLDVLTEAAALELLEKLIGESKIEAEPNLAKELCKWLGYLPLGLELVGRYIALDKSLTIEKTLKRLEKQKLKARALLDPKQATMTAQLGVTTAFDLSWNVLSPEAQELGCYLSLFDSEPFKWSWVETAWIESDDEDERELQIEDLEELRNWQLINRSLVKVVADRQSSTNYNYQLHLLIAQYFRAKLEERKNSAFFKQKFCAVMLGIAQSIPYPVTQSDIKKVALAIPHLSHIATKLIDYVRDENLIWLLESLRRFYTGQGTYARAQQWTEKILQTCYARLGEEHSDVATGINNLAYLYRLQGKYSEAENFYLKALNIRKRSRYENPDVAQSLNNLAALYQLQGKYSEAEPLLLQALTLSKRLFGENHLNVATSLNNLAELYRLQGKYSEVEPLLLKALTLSKRLFGENHIFIASSLNNLGLLFVSQGKYLEAEKFYLQALALSKQLRGEQHPNISTTLNNLVQLYTLQEKYLEAENLALQALAIDKKLLGKQHPNVASSLNTLALLYMSMKRYNDAEPLFLQALKILEVIFGEDHLYTNKVRSNFKYALLMKYINFPEVEMRKVLPEEICEQLLQYKQQLESES